MGIGFDVVILSLFCAGGLFAYVREVYRLRQLIASGKTAVATILDTREDSAGSESVTHYFVNYEFLDSEGRRSIHEQDLNSRRFFERIKRGDKIEILYGSVSSGNSYPIDLIHSDIKLNGLISVGIIIFWASMAAYFALD